jgi:hypothetical protein
MSFTTPIDALFVGKLAAFAPLASSFHAAGVHDVDALIDLFSASAGADVHGTMAALTSAPDAACLDATVRELGVYRDRLRAVALLTIERASGKAALRK